MMPHRGESGGGPRRAARLCLNMIVKNEAAIIERCLASVSPVVDCYLVCDTGSGDGTGELVRDFFLGRGIPGAVHTIPFADFSQARNQALEVCRASALVFDYVLLADADMELVVEDSGFRSALTAPAYLVQQRNGLDYYNVRLLRRDVAASYRGATHEYLDVDGERERLETIHFIDHASGSNRPFKIERDIALLQRELAAAPDNGRAMFYLAQSYMDAGRFSDAVEWYEKRLATGGWDEELWYSRLALARCHKHLGDEAAFVRLCVEAYDERPWRSEPLHALAHHFRMSGRYEACMLVCEAGERIPYPRQDALFVEAATYERGFVEEMAIAGYYCRDPYRRARGRDACLALATDRISDTAARATARHNLVYYAPLAAELFPGFETRPLATSPWPGTAATNPSIGRHGDCLAAIVRCVNYSVNEGAYAVHDAAGTIRTRNLFVTLDEDLQIASSVELIDHASPAPLAGAVVVGFEDCRLFHWRGRWWASSTVRDRSPSWRCQIALIAWETDGSVTEMRLLQEIEPGRHEKNWIPLVRGDDLLFVYSSDPVRILRYDPSCGRLDEHRSSEPAVALDHLRGGSQAVPIRDGWLYLTHETAIRGDSRVYLHRFVHLDRELRLRALSHPFSLVRTGIEFCAGLVYEPRRSRLVASFGVNDGEALLGTFLEEEVFASLWEPERS